MGSYIQYGCGLCAPAEWTNFDVSPTLRVQKIPLLGSLLTRGKNRFPTNVRYGDIIGGLPGVDPNSADAVFCSHVLEHLSLQDFRIALKNTYSILKSGGTFRLVVPDLEILARGYIENLDSGDREAGIRFIKYTLMGSMVRKKGIKGMLQTGLSNAHHLWMWDHAGMIVELEKAGFTQIRRCLFNDSALDIFKSVEDESRFVNAVAIEAVK